jgi:hypothetical protein
LVRFKARLVEELLARLRRAMDESGKGRMEMQPNAFPPPWSLASGFDFRRAAEYSDGISVKLYGMHWAMMLRSYGERLRSANPQVSESLLMRALVRLFDIEDDEQRTRLQDYRYPGPDEPHAGGSDAQQRKIACAQAEAGRTPVYALAHAYGPLDDFRRRLEIALQASPHGIWLNRYGYLSDQKLEIVRSLVESGIGT